MLGGGRSIRRILVADDDPMMATLLQVFVQGGPETEITVVHSGEAARERVDRAKAAGHTFDVVVTDYHMGGLTGGQLLEHVRAQSPATLRLLVTGSLEGLADPANVHAHEVLRKPVEADRLRAALQRKA